MPRAALSEIEIQDFRDRIVTVASSLFVKHGYEGVTFRALAQGLGCSPMTPYRYFRDKAAIFAAVRAAAYDHFAGVLETANDEAFAPVERIKRIGRAYARFGVENPDAYQLMFALRQANPADYPELRAAENRSWIPLRSAGHAAIDSGALTGDGEELANLCWASIHGLVSLHIAGKLVDASLEALVEPLVRTMIEGNQIS
jgi:AcrR family transcriptional regulator